MRHFVAISDIHLSEAEPETGLWMRYRQKEYTPSAEIAAMIERLLEQVQDDDLTFVLNGDLLDFDAPRVEQGKSEHHDVPRDAAHAAPQAKAILRDHKDFVRGVARVIAAGHTLVIISGNHDVQLTLPEVRAVVRDAIVHEARDLGARATAAELASRIDFRAWLYRSNEGVIFEHGHQYDSFCSFRYPMAPYGKQPGLIQPTLGSLTARLYIGRLGYFNPNVDATFMLTFRGHLEHWARYYMLSPRSQAWIWLHGAMTAIASLIAHRDPGDRARFEKNLAAAAQETGASLASLEAHCSLFAPPGEDRLWTCARELWLDRAFAAGTAAGAIAMWLRSRRPVLGLLAALGPALVAAMDLAQPKTTLEETWRHVQRCARGIAKAHGARAVVLGHTHTPEGTWEDGVFYGNTGSWSAAYRDVACNEPLFDERPLVWLRHDGKSLSGGLCAYKHGVFLSRGDAREPTRPSHPQTESQPAKPMC